MSELPPDDPFSADDPMAAERERRRREREARRAGRSGGDGGARRSLADRVGAALEGAAERGKEAIDGLRDSGRDDGSAEPPDIRSGHRDVTRHTAPAADYEPASETRDFPAPGETGEYVAPVEDESDFAPGSGETGDYAAPGETGEYAAPGETGDYYPATGEAGDYAAGETGDYAVPGEAGDYEPASETGDYPAPGETGDYELPASRPLPARPRAMRGISPRGGGGGHDVYWRRRVAAGGVAIGAVLLLVAVIALAGRGGGEEEPVAAEPEPIETIDVTVPEGLTIDQMAAVADDAGLRGNYKRAARQAMDDFNLRRYGAEDAPDLEGFLFPATYELERRAPASDLVSRQLEAFEQNLEQVNMRKAERRNLTVYDVVKIASMIEREVSIDEERRLASAVIHNRLSDGEPLGIDATLRYELDKHDGQLLESELQADTPYNTRTRAGLPPTPIANPGLASLEAAADPANRDFRYYVIKPGTCNEHLFTADPAEFEAAVAEYQAALEAEGGSPTEC